MIATILIFLRSHWLGASVVAGGLGIFTLITVQHMEIESLRKKVTESAAENITLSQANSALVASIQNQNDAIGQLQARALANKKASLATRKNSEAITRNYRIKADKLKAMATSGNECADLKNLVHGYVGNVR